MNSDQELAMCGCRCDLCKAYAPNVQKNDQRKTLAEMWNKYYGLDPSVMGICDGCRSDNPSDTECPVRKCVLEKGLNHCGDCGDFPCEVFYQRCGSFPDEKKKDFDMVEYAEYMFAYDNETRLKEYKTKQEQLEKVSAETMRFMRGKYVLDEVGDGKDKLEFREGGATILTIYIRENRYDFIIDSKCVPVADMETLEAVKQTIMIKKTPNRMPFPKEVAVYSDCGHRCDLCIHYNVGEIDEDFRMTLIERVNRVYSPEKTAEESRATLPMCNGCGESGFGEGCPQRDCAGKKGVKRCLDCPEYDCGKATAGIPPKIHIRTYLADDVTWAILPYVAMQYGN